MEGETTGQIRQQIWHLQKLVAQWRDLIEAAEARVARAAGGQPLKAGNPGRPGEDSPMP